MRHLPILLSLMALFASSCSPKEEEQEPDYDNMVMAGDEEEDWISDEERDRKMIADDLPDPQELIILEPSDLL